MAAEGKTSMAVSLAMSLAEPGNRVLLIDGDIQAPRIARLLNLMSPHDLKDLLFGERRLMECVVHTRVPGLDVLTTNANGESIRTALNTQSVKRVIQEAVELYDHVIIDSPPALGTADALTWAHVVDGVIISSLASKSDRTAIKLTCDRLRTVGAKLLGSVIANVSIAETYYSYSTASRREDEDASKGTANARSVMSTVYLPDMDSDSNSTGS
jgi:capsular exopolysaccharide synthesis family protein